PILDGNGPALEPTQLVQTPHERGDPRTLGQCGARSKIPDSPQSRGLLPLRRNRPRSRAADQPNDPAPAKIAHGVAHSACRPGRELARRHSQSTAVGSVSQEDRRVLWAIPKCSESGTGVTGILAGVRALFVLCEYGSQCENALTELRGCGTELPHTTLAGRPCLADRREHAARRQRRLVELSAERAERVAHRVG